MFVLKFTIKVLQQPCHSIIFKRLVCGKVRVRFAPSPTGYLHLGGLRTALYNHIFAKSQNGVTILRIEDTDLARKVSSAAENLEKDLAWCGITYDEGPYFQSERREIYQQYSKQLVDQGDAYYCFCSNTRLNLIKREAVKLGEIPKYDNHCRHLSQEEIEHGLKNTTSCIRFKLSKCKDSYNDLIFGYTNHDVAAHEGDPVILKSDGFPTYHFANVVDDHLMNITHVLRGIEWLTSTPKHIQLYRAFKWNPPQFGHFPLLLNPDGTKLSKRQGHIQVKNLRERGYLPNSIINFLIRFGGGFDITAEKHLRIYTFDEIVQKFDISKIKSASCKASLELLPSYNHAEILKLLETDNGRQSLVKKTQELVRRHFQDSKHQNSLQLSDERVESILTALKNRISFLEDIVNEDFGYLWVWEKNWNETDESINEVIKNLITSVKTLNWTYEELKEFLKVFSKQNKHLKHSEVLQSIRLALTGKKQGHSILEILSVLSKEDVLFRLSKTVETKSTSAASQN